MIPFVTEANNWAKAKITERNVLKIAESGNYRYPVKVTKKITFSIYADDIVLSTNGKISGHKREDYIKMINYLLEKYTPLRLNNSKTKYINVQQKGGAWVTGLMINREHNVTVGREKKEKLKATIFSFLADCKNGKPWDEHRIRQMMGTVSYIRHIEPEFVDMIIEKYNQKLGMDYHAQIKSILYS